MSPNPPLSLFSRALALWLSLFGLMAGIYVVVDPAGLFRWKADLMPRGYCPNRAVMSLANFEHFNPYKHFDSFLIGSSLSIYFPIDHWAKYLPADARPFHFDGSSLDISELKQTIDYLASKTDLKNALIIWDWQAFDWIDLNDAPYRTPPAIEQDWMERCITHYMFFSNWYGRPFMNDWISNILLGAEAHGDVKTPRAVQAERIDNETNEISQPTADEQRQHLSDSLLSIYPRTAHEDVTYVYSALDNDRIDSRQETYLTEVAAKLDSLGTDYYFVMVPSNRNKVPSPHDDNIMRRVFGSRYVMLHPYMTYVCRNQFNYFADGYHMRPAVTKKIMDKVYGLVRSIPN